VHIGGQLTARLLALCAICALIPGRRVVLSLHSGGYPSGAGRNVGAASLTGLVLRRLDALIAVNEEIAQLFRRLGVSPARISVICPYTPVMVRRDTPLPEEIRRFVDSHSPVVTTVGLLEPEYDLTLQIRTMTKIRQRHPQAGLVIVGSGSLESQLRRQIDAEPDGKHVLLCGDVSHAHTVRLLHESDLVLRTTLYDGDSVSVREALQLGVPVIASDNGMRPAGVHLIPVADAVALEQSVDRVLRAPRLAPAPSMAAEGDLEAIRALYSALVGREVGVRRPPLASVP
jgi:glycosyltransferase involved in cell wall biosynthesis